MEFEPVEKDSRTRQSPQYDDEAVLARFGKKQQLRVQAPTSLSLRIHAYSHATGRESSRHCPRSD